MTVEPDWGPINDNKNKKNEKKSDDPVRSQQKASFFPRRTKTLSTSHIGPIKKKTRKKSYRTPSWVAFFSCSSTPHKTKGNSPSLKTQIQNEAYMMTSKKKQKNKREILQETHVSSFCHLPSGMRRELVSVFFVKKCAQVPQGKGVRVGGQQTLAASIKGRRESLCKALFDNIRPSSARTLSGNAYRRDPDGAPAGSPST